MMVAMISKSLAVTPMAMLSRSAFHAAYSTASAAQCCRGSYIKLCMACTCEAPGDASRKSQLSVCNNGVVTVYLLCMVCGTVPVV